MKDNHAFLSYFLLRYQVLLINRAPFFKQTNFKTFLGGHIPLLLLPCLTAILKGGPHLLSSTSHSLLHLFQSGAASITPWKMPLLISPVASMLLNPTIAHSSSYPTFQQHQRSCLLLLEIISSIGFQNITQSRSPSPPHPSLVALFCPPPITNLLLFHIKLPKAQSVLTLFSFYTISLSDLTHCQYHVCADHLEIHISAAFSVDLQTDAFNSLFSGFTWIHHRQLKPNACKTDLIISPSKLASPLLLSNSVNNIIICPIAHVVQVQ